MGRSLGYSGPSIRTTSSRHASKTQGLSKHSFEISIYPSAAIQLTTPLFSARPSPSLSALFRCSIPRLEKSLFSPSPYSRHHDPFGYKTTFENSNPYQVFFSHLVTDRQGMVGSLNIAMKGPFSLL
jgi:hypothetical protein